MLPEGWNNWSSIFFQSSKFSKNRYIDGQMSFCETFKILLYIVTYRWLLSSSRFGKSNFFRNRLGASKTSWQMEKVVTTIVKTWINGILIMSVVMIVEILARKQRHRVYYRPTIHVGMILWPFKSFSTFDGLMIFTLSFVSVSRTLETYIMSMLLILPRTAELVACVAELWWGKVKSKKEGHSQRIQRFWFL